MLNNCVTPEEILELGFKKTEFKNNFILKIKEKVFRLHSFYDYNMSLIRKGEGDPLLIIMECDLKEPYIKREQLFKGNIYNKEELKVLLNQLRILNAK